ncbi:hypothetical protein ZHAS_00014853 [Anopheles sinensis]|uniref:Uncharacterized protein n=1 Tax=Anopheles sinensis TaxID=74873 RepID=A0A084W9F5_ANOSI|nr:hypothetical protein ZHAS_00014853 [Anopheles sinensis]
MRDVFSYRGGFPWAARPRVARGNERRIRCCSRRQLTPVVVVAPICPFQFGLLGNTTAELCWLCDLSLHDHRAQREPTVEICFTKNVPEPKEKIRLGVKPAEGQRLGALCARSRSGIALYATFRKRPE